MSPNQPAFPDWEEPEPSLEALIECVEREIAYRKRVYPRRVWKKTMTQDLADKQIRLMEGVLKNLVRQLHKG
jgi:hypothetical protein